MITEYEIEPIPGLPALLPPGEQIVWQGKPDRSALARGAFHSRLIAAYFAMLVGVAVIALLLRGGSWLGVGLTLAAGVAALGIVHLLAWATARSAVYTLTNKRIVLRVGIALPKCINLPLPLVAAVDLHTARDGTGDIALTIGARQQIGYLGLWPHARAWRVSDPQPMLRAVPDAARIGAIIARHCTAGRVTPVQPVSSDRFGEAVAA